MTVDDERVLMLRALRKGVASAGQLCNAGTVLVLTARAVRVFLRNMSIELTGCGKPKMSAPPTLSGDMCKMDPIRGAARMCP